jgi:sugar O-acyltransferase (sialic acid O-acetyltransferase NeuD family)
LDNGKLLLLGAGGHCRSVLDSIDKSIYTDIVIVDMPEKVGQLVYDVPVVGTDDDVHELFRQGYREAVITLGSVGNPIMRAQLYHLLKTTGFSITTIIDPTSVVSKQGTFIDEGVFIGKGAIVNSGVVLGTCCIINSGAILDHDSRIGSFVHVSPGVCLSGKVVIGNNTHIGTGSSIIENIEIGENTTIGAGSTVVRNIPGNVIAFGNPCKIQRNLE